MSKFESGDLEVKKPAPENWFAGPEFEEAERQRKLRRDEESTPEALEASYLVAQIETKMLGRQPRRYYAMPLKVNNLEDHVIGGTEYTVEFARTTFFSNYRTPETNEELWGLYYTKRIIQLDPKPAIGRLRNAPPCVKLAFLDIAVDFVGTWRALDEPNAQDALAEGRLALTLL